MTNGKFTLGGEPVPPWKRIPSLEDYYRGPDFRAKKSTRLRKECTAKGASLHGVLMDRAGWPAIPFDGQLLVSHQDALLMGGKVQAPPGYADHVVFLYPELCEKCGAKICIELCSGQAITPGETGVPAFRPREMRPLRRVPVELFAAGPGKSRAHEHRLSRRHGRAALGGELIMNVSIILAHPNPGSFNYAIAAAADGHGVALHDLCAEQFPALLTAAELTKHAALEPVVAAHCREIAAADGILIVHPNWWGMPPAILKGWIDRVLRMEVAYRFVANDQGEGVPVGLLKAKSGHGIQHRQHAGGPQRARPLAIRWKRCGNGACLTCAA